MVSICLIGIWCRSRYGELANSVNPVVCTSRPVPFQEQVLASVKIDTVTKNDSRRHESQLLCQPSVDLGSVSVFFDTKVSFAGSG